MVRSVKATYKDGVLEPAESPDLEDGQEVGLSISEAGDAPDATRERVETAGSWKGLVDAERLKRDIYESRQIVTRSERARERRSAFQSNT